MNKASRCKHPNRARRSWWLALALCACVSAGAQTASDSSSLASEAQAEADLRVIAARCGTPGFEKQFFFASQAAVRAGLVSKRSNPADLEKKVTALRRSPFVLIAANADCKVQMARLKEVMKERSQALAVARRGADRRAR